MSRSLKKGPFIDPKLAKKIAALGAEDRTIIKTWARSRPFPLISLAGTLAIHNGKVHVPVYVTENIGSDTNLANSAQPGSSAPTAVKWRKVARSKPWQYSRSQNQSA